MEINLALATPSVAPFLMTTKSEIEAYQADEPKLGPMIAEAQGDSRIRWYCKRSEPPAMLVAPMESGMRPPEDSPRNTMGDLVFAATSFRRFIFRLSTGLLEAPSTVKSFDAIAICRPPIWPKPVI